MMRKVTADDLEYGRRCAFCGDRNPDDWADIAIESYREGFEQDLAETSICMECHGKLFFGKEEAEMV